MDEKMMDLSCARFTEELASKAPVPGGGGAAAMTGSTAAALGCMAANLTIGKKKFLAFEEDHRRIISECDALRLRFLELMDEDAAAFGPLAKAYAMDKNDPSYAETMRTVTIEAAKAPLGMMDCACRLIALLVELEGKCSRLLISDVGCAAVSARAALEAASLNVFVNTRTLPDDPEACAMADKAQAMLEKYVPCAQAVADKISETLKGNKTEGKKMMIGCCAPAEKVKQVAADGYDYIELPGFQLAAMSEAEIDALAAELAAAGLPALRLNSYCSGSPAICGPAFDAAAAKEYAERLSRYAHKLGIKTLGVGAPAARRLPEGFDRTLARSQCEEFLRVTCAAAAPYGIDVLLEALQPGCCNFVNDTAEAFDIAEKLALPNLFLVLDLYHMKNNGESWNDVPRYISLTRHAHISTTLEGNSRGLYGAGSEEECRDAFAALKAAGYTGTVSIEPDPSALTPEATAECLALMRSCV